MEVNTVGILGAGKVGIVLAQLFLKAGYNVLIAGSSDPSNIALTVKVLAPGAQALRKETVAERADVVILALPLGKYRTVPKNELKGKLVIDAMNYWWEVDGRQEKLTGLRRSTSEIIQAYLPDAIVVKAFSHIGYHELHDEHRPAGTPDRKAVAIAADNEAAAQTVAQLVDAIGFDPYRIGPLKNGVMLEPGSDIFGAHVDTASLEALIRAFPESERGKAVLAARNRQAL